MRKTKKAKTPTTAMAIMTSRNMTERLSTVPPIPFHCPVLPNLGPQRYIKAILEGLTQVLEPYANPDHREIAKVYDSG